MHTKPYKNQTIYIILYLLQAMHIHFLYFVDILLHIKLLHLYKKFHRAGPRKGVGGNRTRGCRTGWRIIHSAISHTKPTYSLWTFLSLLLFFSTSFSSLVLYINNLQYVLSWSFIKTIPPSQMFYPTIWISGSHIPNLQYTVIKVSDIPVPSRDVTYQTLPGQEPFFTLYAIIKGPLA